MEVIHKKMKVLSVKQITKYNKKIIHCLQTRILSYIYFNALFIVKNNKLIFLIDNVFRNTYPN